MLVLLLLAFSLAASSCGAVAELAYELDQAGILDDALADAGIIDEPATGGGVPQQPDALTPPPTYTPPAPPTYVPPAPPTYTPPAPPTYTPPAAAPVAETIGLTSGNPLYWDQRRWLQPSDFLGPRPSDNPEACTASDIIVECVYGDGYLDWEAHAVFDPARSFFGPLNTSWEFVLAHEQGHFDLTEVFTRNLRAQLASYSTAGKSASQIKADLQSMRLSMELQCQQQQLQYDWDIYGKYGGFDSDIVAQQQWWDLIEYSLATSSDWAY